MPTFARVHLAFERGEGVWLMATDGERYLDFTSGVAVNALGHAHPHLVAALTEQAQKLWHVSNLYEIPEAERVAQRLCDASFADVVFFCNSGAEAVECAIKTARKYQSANGQPGALPHHHLRGRVPWPHAGDSRRRRTEKISRRLRPGRRGFRSSAVRRSRGDQAAIGAETAAIMIEPLMGEGGVRVIAPSFLQSACANFATEHGLLLIFDEVQTGMGRTGELFAYQRTGVTPDIMALAKALGGGFPVGACLATREAAKGMTAGTHGSTFGGNPLAMSAANAMLDVMLAPGFFDHVQRIALLFKQRLAEIKDRYPSVIAEVRGEGLLIGVQARGPGRRTGRRDARRKDDHGGRRRQCRAPAAAAHHQRTGTRGRRYPARSGLRPARPRALRKRRNDRGGRMSGVRHFLDLIDIPAADLRRMIEAARAMKSKRITPIVRSPARRWR